MSLQKISYDALNPRQKENYNFQKVSAVLADYGFVTLRLNDDWQGADFIAQHIDGETFLKIQLKSRLTLDKRYINKQLYICFPYKAGVWFLYPHDEMVSHLIGTTNLGNTNSWQQHDRYSMNRPSKSLLNHLEQYKL